jgi:hypothetical protein
MGAIKQVTLYWVQAGKVTCWRSFGFAKLGTTRSSNSSRGGRFLALADCGPPIFPLASTREANRGDCRLT